jgi:hypothetical protein
MATRPPRCTIGWSTSRSLGEDALWPSGAHHCYRRRGDGRGASSRASGGETARDAARGVRHLSRRDVPAQVDARRLRPAGDGSNGAASPSSSRSTRSPRWTTGHGDPTPRVQQRSMATVIRRALRPDGVPSEHFRPDGVPQAEGAAVRAAPDPRRHADLVTGPRVGCDPCVDGVLRPARPAVERARARCQGRERCPQPRSRVLPRPRASR